MDIVISSEVEELMSKRGITTEDIKTVIKKSQLDKTFLVADDGSILAKARLESFCPYVAYEKDGNVCVIKTVYAHRVHLGSEVN